MAVLTPIHDYRHIPKRHTRTLGAIPSLACLARTVQRGLLGGLLLVTAVSVSGCLKFRPEGLSPSSVVGSLMTFVFGPAPLKYALGGNVTGIAVGMSGLKLKNDDGQVVTIDSNGSFVFPQTYVATTAYAVAIDRYPTDSLGYAEVCLLGGGSGAMGAGDALTVSVACQNAALIETSVNGLLGKGLILLNNGGDPLTVNGPLPDGSTAAFFTPLAGGDTYAVTVGSHPTSPWQTCVPSNGSDTITGALPTVIKTPSITCTTNPYPVGGTIIGYHLPGLELEMSVNGGAYAPLAAQPAPAGGMPVGFAFPPVDSMSTYDVRIAAQPAGQVCSLSFGSGTIAGSAITNVIVNCDLNVYIVGGGLSARKGAAPSSVGTGLTLQLTHGSTIVSTVTPAVGATNYSFPYASLIYGSSVQVDILQSPTNPFQVCTFASPPSGVALSNGNKTATVTTMTATIANLDIACTTNPYQLRVETVGLAGTSGQLGLKNVTTGDQLSLNTDGTFTLPTTMYSGDNYVLSLASPTDRACNASSTTGTGGASNYVDVTINCKNQYYVTVTINGDSELSDKGPAGTGLALTLQKGGADVETVKIAVGTITVSFKTPFATNDTYEMHVSTPVAGGGIDETCEFSAGNTSTGTVTVELANPAPVLTCVRNTHNITGTVLGLFQPGGDTLTVSGYDSKSSQVLIKAASDNPTNGDKLSIPVKSGVAYNLTLKPMPSIAKRCFFASGAQTGTMGEKGLPATIECHNLYKTVSAGVNHVLAIREDGTLWAWGSNASGQVGNGSTTTPSFPTLVDSNPKWTAVAAGGAFSLALYADGTLWVWGANDAYQLGGVSGSPQETKPTQYVGATFSEIAAGNAEGMAVTAAGKLYVWGQNAHGQLGTGDTNPVKTISVNPKKSGVAAPALLSLGSTHSMVVDASTLFTAGASTYGQLGWKCLTADCPDFGKAGVDNPHAVAAGGDHSLAINGLNGSLWTWGANAAGQLGNGTLKGVDTPVQIGTNKWLTLAAGSEHSVGIQSDGSLWTWGSNMGDALGLGNDGCLYDKGCTHLPKPQPVTGKGLVIWTAVSAGKGFTLALRKDGTLWGWGSNGTYQLGTGKTENVSVPVQIW